MRLVSHEIQEGLNVVTAVLTEEEHLKWAMIPGRITPDSNELGREILSLAGIDAKPSKVASYENKARGTCFYVAECPVLSEAP